MECPTSFSSIGFVVERESTGLGLAKSFVDLELDPHSCHISRSDAKYTNHFILRYLNMAAKVVKLCSPIITGCRNMVLQRPVDTRQGTLHDYRNDDSPNKRLFTSKMKEGCGFESCCLLKYELTVARTSI